MGTLNLTQFLSEVRGFFADRSDLTDETMISHLNMAQEQLASTWPWEELDNDETTPLVITADKEVDKVISLTNIYLDIYTVRLITADGGSKKLERISRNQFDIRFPEPEFIARNDPIFYIFWKLKLEVFPVPDTADNIKVRGIKKPTAFVSSSPSITSDFDLKDQILIYMTVSSLCDRLAQYERARQFFSVANAKIEIAKDEQATKPDLNIKPDFEMKSRIPGEYWNRPFIKGIR